MGPCAVHTRVGSKPTPFVLVANCLCVPSQEPFGLSFGRSTRNTVGKGIGSPPTISPDVGVPLTQCAAEGKHIYVCDCIYVLWLFCIYKNSIFWCSTHTYFQNKYSFYLHTYLFTKQFSCENVILIYKISRKSCSFHTYFQNKYILSLELYLFCK